MTHDQVVTLLVLAGAMALFVTEAVPLGVTGLCIITALGLTGVLASEWSVASPPVLFCFGLSGRSFEVGFPWTTASSRTDIPLGTS